MQDCFIQSHIYHEDTALEENSEVPNRAPYRVSGGPWKKNTLLRFLEKNEIRSQKTNAKCSDIFSNCFQ